MRGRSGEREKEPKRIACIGDSITYGYHIRDRRRTYPAILQDLLGGGVAVRNFGNSGRGVMRRSLKLGQKRAFVFVSQHQSALAWRPDLVICNLGINDLMDWERYGETDFVDDYRVLIRAYKALDTRPRIILWHRLAPLFPGQPYHGHPAVEELNARIAETAALEELETIDMVAPLGNHPEWFPDRIHPNEAGAAAIARATVDFLGGCVT